VAPLLLMAQHVHVAQPHQQLKELKVAFSPEMSEKMTEGDSKMIEFQLGNMQDFDDRFLEVEVKSIHPEIASIQYVGNSNDFSPNTNWTGSFNLTAKFLGYSQIVVKLWGNISTNNQTKDRELVAQSQPGKVAVVRHPRAIDKAFIYTIAILVSVAFINMGCLLDLEIVKATLKKPIGPVIGFCCQYLFMPLVSIAIMFFTHFNYFGTNFVFFEKSIYFSVLSDLPNSF
jgi:sodium/bile acid cotransporter 3/5